VVNASTSSAFIINHLNLQDPEMDEDKRNKNASHAAAAGTPAYGEHRIALLDS
jgi:hypothetical protein